MATFFRLNTLLLFFFASICFNFLHDDESRLTATLYTKFDGSKRQQILVARRDFLSMTIVCFHKDYEDHHPSGFTLKFQSAELSLMSLVRTDCTNVAVMRRSTSLGFTQDVLSVSAAVDVCRRGALVEQELIILS